MNKTAEEVRLARFNYLTEKLKDITKNLEVLQIDDCLYGISWPDISMETDESTFKPVKSDKMSIYFVANCEDLEIFNFGLTIQDDTVEYSYSYPNLDCFPDAKMTDLEESLKGTLTIPTVMEKLGKDLKYLLQQGYMDMIITACKEAYHNIH